MSIKSLFNFLLLSQFSFRCKNKHFQFFSLILSVGKSSIYVFCQFFQLCFCNGGRFVHSPISLVKIGCSLHIIKNFSILGDNFSAELVLEYCIEALQVLICETKSVQNP